jgi:hypothetical protein
MLIKIASIIVITFATCLAAMAQAADGRSPIAPTRDDEHDRPLSFREQLDKLRIQREKKEFAEMLERGKDAVKASEQLERSFAESGQMTSTELAKLATLEKLIKKIRSDLGGDDDSDKNVKYQTLGTAADLVRDIRETTERLFRELNKTSRFSISLGAIQTANYILRTAKFLRQGNN